MSYWWKNPITRMRMIGKTIVRVSSEGCQSRNEFHWAGRVKGFKKNDKLNCTDIVIEIVIHNHYHTDARYKTEPEIYTYPLVNADIQNVKGVWVLFA